MRKLQAVAAVSAALLSVHAFASADHYALGDGHSGALIAATATDVVNAYAPMAADAGMGATAISVGAVVGTGTFAAGDLVMLWQVTAAPADTFLSADGGAQGDYDLSTSTTTSHFELARVQSVALPALTLTEALVSNFVGGSTQVVRVPEYSSVDIAAGRGVTAPAWNGRTGGIVAFLSQGTVQNAGTINVNGLGFRGAVAGPNDGSSGCLLVDGPNPAYGLKGEGIRPPASAAVAGGMGNLLNAGGGGNCHNAGGAGGGGRFRGGNAGGRWSDNADFGGRGGAGILLGLHQLTFGGGGGAGHVNQSAGINGSGAAGGGAIYVRANAIVGAGTFTAVGADAPTNPEQCDPAGGGGGGGVISLRTVGALSCTLASVNGGKGGNHNGDCGTYTSLAMGVGGGGGVGHLLLQSASGTCTVSAVQGAVGTASGTSSTFAQPGFSGTQPVPPPGSYLTPIVTAPVNGSATSNTTPTLTAVGEPGLTIFIFVDGTQVCSGVASGAGVLSCTQPSALSYGVHAVTGRQSSTGLLAGAGPTSAASNFTVAPAPSATVTAPAVINIANVAAYPVSGTCTTGAGTLVLTVGAASTSGVVCSGGVFTGTVDVSALADAASITVTAAQTNILGTASNSTTTRKDTAVVPPVIVTPLAGDSVAPNPQITGTSESLASITVRNATTMATLCTATANPAGGWNCTATLGAGNYVVNATQTDTAGNTSANSGSRTFDVVATPNVSVTTPAVINASNAIAYPVNGGCTTGSGTVSVTVGSASPVTVACVANAFSASINAGAVADAPSVNVTASQTNIAGAGSDTKTTSKDTVALAPAITSPSPSANVGPNPSVSGTAEANAAVMVAEGMTALCMTVANGSGQWSCTTSLGMGLHSVTAVQVDVAGNTSPASGATSFTVVGVPSVAVTAPGAVNAANASSYTVSGTCTTAAGTVTVSVGAVVATTPCAAGSYSVAVDVQGLADVSPLAVAASQVNPAGVGSDSKNTVKDTRVSAPSVTSPANGATVSLTPILSGVAERGASVTVKEGAATVCTAVADLSGNWSCNTALGAGPHTILATQVDVAGNPSGATQVTFSVANVPNVALNSPGAINAATVSAFPVSGVCDAAAGQVTVRVGTLMASAACINGSFSVSLNASALADNNAVAVTASQTTPSGTGSDTKQTVKDTVVAAPVLVSPGSGSTVGLSPTVNGTAEAGATVTVREALGRVCTAVANSFGVFSCATGLGVGTHTLVATQTDVAGNASAGTAALTFTVGNVPSVGLNVPGPINAGNAAAYGVSGTCDSSAGQVTVSVQAVTAQVACSAGVFTASLNVSAESDGLAVTVSAAQTGPGGTGTVNAVTRKDTVASVPVIVAPAASALIFTPATLSGTAEAGGVVTVKEGANTLCQTVADALGAWSCQVALSPGAHSVVVSQVDTSGNSSAVSAARAFTVLDAPVVTLNVPAAISKSTQFAYTVSGTCTDGAGDVTVRMGSVSGTAACAQGAFAVTLDVAALPDGTVTLEATQANGTGVGTASSTAKKDTVPPGQPVITSPQGGQTFASAPTVSGTAEPLATVTVFVDGIAAGTVTVDTNGQWTLTLPATVTAGAHTLTAHATDSVGNTGMVSAEIAITLGSGGMGLAPTLTSPSEGASFVRSQPLVIEGKASPGATVDIYVDGVKVATVIADSNGDYRYELPGGSVSKGPHEIKVAVAGVGQSTVNVNATHAQVSFVGGGIGCSASGNGWATLAGLASVWALRRRRRI